MAIETNLAITVLADADYRYVVNIGDMLSVEYVQDGSDVSSHISFGSKEEMKAVANAMLKAANF